jgi:hypothetical protein
MSDFFRGTYGDAEGLRYAMMTLTAISLAAAVIAWLGRNAIRRDADLLGGPARA